MYVTRFTFTPAYDIQRNWSAWMGEAWDNEEEALTETLETVGVLAEDIEERWEKWQDVEWHTWHYRETESFIDCLRDLASDHNVDVRFNEVYCRWQHVHHDGLSCWPLAAETEIEAMAEAAARSFSWTGFGHRTLGNVRHVCALGNDLHLFECADTTPED